MLLRGQRKLLGLMLEALLFKYEVLLIFILMELPVDHSFLLLLLNLTMKKSIFEPRPLKLLGISVPLMILSIV